MTAEPAHDNGSFFDGAALLRVIATALVRMSRTQVPGEPLYDATVQQAYDHLVLRSLRSGIEPPHSVADMARWAAEIPLASWPIAFPAEVVPDGVYLVDAQTRTPTQQCVEWAVHAPSAADEVYENAIMKGALELTRSLDAPDAYVAFRRLLIERPTLTGVERTRVGAETGLDFLHDIVKRAYEPAPAAYLDDGYFHTCARCGCLLLRGPGGFGCELDRCRKEGGPRVGRTLPADREGGVYQVGRPLRVFITGPGLAETDLETRLTEIGLPVQMWPNFDAYDLRITFPDGEVWAVDVKDRANPALLGRAARPLPSRPPHDLAFLVVPRYRFDEREDYRRVFHHHRTGAPHGRIDLLTDQEFVERVQARTTPRPGTASGDTSTANTEVHDA